MTAETRYNDDDMTETGSALEVTIRKTQPSDLDAGARILYDAFKSIADLRGFEPDFPSLDIARSMATIFLNHPRFYGVAAEADGQLVGLNFLSERGEIRGVGPIVVDPRLQGRGIGRAMMSAILERAKDARGVRLVQDTSNPVSLALYESLGFNVREPLFLLYGVPKGEPQEGYEARALRPSDLKACNELCYKIHGFERSGELEDALTHFGSLVLIRRGRIVAYASAPTLWVMNHGVAETDKDLKALILHAGMIKSAALSLLVPGRNNDFFRWCLSVGLHIAKPMTLMTQGFYQEPNAPWYPSVEY